MEIQKLTRPSRFFTALIRVSIIFGTRPEFIKLARLIQVFRAEPSLSLDVCFTGQHREMVLPLLEFFEVCADHSLDIMRPNQALAGLSARSLTAVEEYLQNIRPEIVFVQGDTTTAMCAATAAFYRKIKIAHVEAGLRTRNMASPFPEEFNRQVISKIANLHFAPTPAAGENLRKEGVDHGSVFVTGNTVIDALFFAKKKIEGDPIQYRSGLPWKGERLILITGHRRENFGAGFENICEAIRRLAAQYPGYCFVYPVHLNPNVQEPVRRRLGGLSNVILTPPLDYVGFLSLMNQCHLILTDSGGVQEEAPSLGKPVLVMRDTTERPEAVENGAAMLVGTDSENIVSHVIRLMEDPALYSKMATAGNPFGDGRAVERITRETLRYFL